MSEKYNMEKVKATVLEVLNNEFTDADNDSLIIAVSTKDKTALFTHASQAAKMEVVSRIIHGMLFDDESPYPPHVLAMFIMGTLGDAMQAMLKTASGSPDEEKPKDIDAPPPADIDSLPDSEVEPPVIN